MLIATLIALYLVGIAAEAARAEPRAKRHITSLIVATQYRQIVMGVRPTPTRYQYKTSRGAWLRSLERRWIRKAGEVLRVFLAPPHHGDWLCIHGFEGSWRDRDDPYWGGLQMDRGFMTSYAPRLLLRRGWANAWTPIEQMWVAERAHRSGRGFWPWPNTARFCGAL